MNEVPSATNIVVKHPPSDDEWLPWTEYVYLWVCSFPGGTRVKVGMTNNPDRRAVEFRTNSPFSASSHWVCQCPDRAAAYGLEQTILSRFSAWRSKGEWIACEAKRIPALIVSCTAIARQEIDASVRFRPFRPRKPNGERFRRKKRY